MNLVRLFLVATTTLALVFLIGSDLRGADTSKKNASKTTDSRSQVELRGRVVSLAEEMHERFGADLPTKHDPVYGLKTSDGKYYTLLRTKSSEALFADSEVRQRELLLKGHLFAGSQIFEPMTIRSVKKGVVYDVIYWCDTCSIESIAPGICDCCQGPVRLIERPVK
jgi:hypothetical protein